MYNSNRMPIQWQALSENHVTFLTHTLFLAFNFFYWKKRKYHAKVCPFSTIGCKHEQVRGTTW
jgi:hypothetical protein